MTILVLDPGESTGWVAQTDTELTGGTIRHDRVEIWNLLCTYEPDVVVFETFKLYPSHAKSLLWSTFYTCEIIGILKLYADMYPSTVLVDQGASVKKYSGARPSQEAWKLIHANGINVTEHTYDAYMHLCYYLKEHG